jgi:hypothetical protein
MAKNIGYLTSKHTPESDEVYTPEFAVKAIAKHLDKNRKILSPFSLATHAFPAVLNYIGYDCHYSHYNPETGEGRDFFSYDKKEINALGNPIIVDNPPFSLKDKVLEYCEFLNVDYALLLPLPTLQSKARYDNVFSKGHTQLLIFRERLGYSTRETHWKEHGNGLSNHFASIFICRGVLQQELIFDSFLNYIND